MTWLWCRVCTVEIACFRTSTKTCWYCRYGISAQTKWFSYNDWFLSLFWRSFTAVKAMRMWITMLWEPHFPYIQWYCTEQLLDCNVGNHSLWLNQESQFCKLFSIFWHLPVNSSSFIFWPIEIVWYFERKVTMFFFLDPACNKAVLYAYNLLQLVSLWK